jgi:hypothetical protein
MNTLIDIAGSIVIGAMVFLVILNLNIAKSNEQYSSDSELQLQQNAKTLADMLEYDLRKIGYKYSGNPFITTDSNKISFYSDIDNNGTIDEVSYLISNPDQVNYTSNPYDRILYRVVNNDTSKGPSLGITRLRFCYYNSIGVTTTVQDSIKYVKTEIWVETPEKVDNTYPFTYWELTINPRNL